MSELPREVLEPTERLLSLLCGSESVPKSTLDRATRMLRPMPQQTPDYLMALKLRLKQSIMENAAESQSSSMALANFEKECERIRKVNPGLLQSALIMMEPLAFSKPRNGGYFHQFKSDKSDTGGGGEASTEDKVKAPANVFRSTTETLTNKSNSNNYDKRKGNTLDVIGKQVNEQAGDFAWVSDADEELLLRDLIFIFQGIPGKYIQYDSRAESYEIKPTMKLRPAVRDTVLCLCEIGWLYGRVAAYIKSANTGSGSGDVAGSSIGKGIVVQSFGSALEVELQDYFRLLSILENEMSRRSRTRLGSRVNSMASEDKFGGLEVEEPHMGRDDAFGTNGSVRRGGGDIAPATAENENDSQKPGGEGLTLLRLRMWMQEPLERLYLMARLVDNAGPLKGGALASRLHGHTQNGDSAIRELVKRVLGTVCNPIYDMLGRWVLHGELHDPYQEFFVGQRAGVSSANIWQEGYYLRIAMLPTYLTHSLAVKVLVIGKSINFMRICSTLLAQRNADNAVAPNLPSEARSQRERKELKAAQRRRESGLKKHNQRARRSVTTRKRGGGEDDEDEEEEEEEEGDTEAPGNQEPEGDGQAQDAFAMSGHAAAAASAAEVLGPALSYAGERHLVEAITRVSRDVDMRLLTLIQSKYKIESHLHALKQFLLLSQGDFVICLMDVVGPELKKRANQLYRHNLSGMLESALRGSNAQYLPSDVLDRVGVKLLQSQPGDTGWEVFSLDYTVDPPLSAVVHKDALSKYRSIFYLLWRLKRVEWTLAGAWKQLLVFSHARGSLDGSQRLKKVLHRCSLNRARMLHVVTTINTYLMFEVLDSEWQALLEKINMRVHSLDDLIATHDTYLDNIMQRALLTASDETLFLQLQTMLQAVLRFCALEETLVADAMAALARKQSRDEAARRHGQEQGGKGEWANTSADSTTEDPDSYDGVPAYVVHRIDEAVRDYSQQFDALMTMLEVQGDSVSDMNAFLVLRLDFNEYHAQEKKKGNSGVVTSTPPVGGGDKTKAAAAEGARSRLSFN